MSLCPPNHSDSAPPIKSDPVSQPSHYMLLDGTEAIQVIAQSMTREEFKGYCLGNQLKYRLRAGKKGDATEDLRKADEYQSLFDHYKHQCRDMRGKV